MVCAAVKNHVTSLQVFPGLSQRLGTQHVYRGHYVQAHPRRVARVAKQIEREIGSLMLTDPVCARLVLYWRVTG
jgi:hypothetical protein